VSGSASMNYIDVCLGRLGKTTKKVTVSNLVKIATSET